eukprot:jgi/Chrzof1/1721/Cz10g18170.t1
MSQSDTVQLRPAQITSHIHTAVDKENQLLSNISGVEDSIVEAALTYVGLGDPEKVSKLRDELLKMVNMEREVRAHQTALQHLMASYAPKAQQQTDFAATLDADVASTLAATTFHPEQADIVKEFDQSMGLDVTVGGDGDMDDDELVVVGGDIQKNTVCPYTGRNIIELDDPVEDSKGFVYSKAALLAAIRGSGQRQWVEAPFPGAHHRVTASDLKPSKRVLRAKKQQRLHATQATGSHTQEQDVVLDA